MTLGIKAPVAPAIQGIQISHGAVLGDLGNGGGASLPPCAGAPVFSDQTVAASASAERAIVGVTLRA